jgi:superfamily II DNA or RNA helicase
MADLERCARVTVMSNTRAVVRFSYPGLDPKRAEKERTRILNLLDDALAIENKGSHFSPAVKAGRWDGRRHVFYKDGGTFPKGVLQRVHALLREAGYTVKKLRDEREHVHGVVDFDRVGSGMLAGITLREDQLDVIYAALQAGCGIAHVATGGGKTEASAAIIKTLNDRRCLFLVHTKQLLKQARERIALRLGTIEEHIGVIGDGKFEPKHITVATVQSLSRPSSSDQKKVIAKYIKTIDLLFLDEVQHAGARSFFRLIQRIDAPFRYGMSGTPFGLADGKGLLVEGAFGPVIARVTNAELGELGVNAIPTIRMIEIKEPKIDDGLDWQAVYKEGIVLNTVRNGVIAREAARFAGKGWPTLILVRELWHGDNLCELLRERKVKHAFVHGKMHTEQVERHKVRLTEGKIHVLIASPIFGEGVDIPSIRALIVADGGQSTAKVLQAVGRGLRAKKDDNRLDVVDFADVTHRWLSSHSQERLALYTGEGFKVKAGSSNEA